MMVASLVESMVEMKADRLVDQKAAMMVASLVESMVEMKADSLVE